jgi:cytochrome bd-type quinol oxidase subunit 2
MAFLLFFHASLKKPTFSTTVSSLCYALSAFGVILLFVHFMIALCGDVPAKIKPDRKSQPSCVFLSPLVGLISCLSLALYQHNQDKVGVDAGESRFFLFTVGAIALLWFEDKASGIADREIIPLCTASILWIGSALLANYAYASLASVTVVLPYLVYFLPLILLGFYYYISAPEES